MKGKYLIRVVNVKDKKSSSGDSKRIDKDIFKEVDKFLEEKEN